MAPSIAAEAAPATEIACESPAGSPTAATGRQPFVRLDLIRFEQSPGSPGKQGTSGLRLVPPNLKALVSVFRILHAVVLQSSNAEAESMSARFQRIKRMACGYRNRERFRRTIIFHLARPDLHSRPVSTHTLS